MARDKVDYNRDNRDPEFDELWLECCRLRDLCRALKRELAELRRSLKARRFLIDNQN